MTDTDSPVPEHIRAAIHAGHVGQVTIFCDGCGVEDTADYTGETREVRFAAARAHLAEVKGWRITRATDLCPSCPDEPAVQQWAVRHPGLGVLPYDDEADARVAAGTAGTVLIRDRADEEWRPADARPCSEAPEAAGEVLGLTNRTEASTETPPTVDRVQVIGDLMHGPDGLPVTGAEIRAWLDARNIPVFIGAPYLFAEIWRTVYTILEPHAEVLSRACDDGIIQAAVRAFEAAQPTYREAANADGLLYQHACGRVRTFNSRPTSGYCVGAGRICHLASEDPADWQPLYVRDETEVTR